MNAERSNTIYRTALAAKPAYPFVISLHYRAVRRCQSIIRKEEYWGTQKVPLSQTPPGKEYNLLIILRVHLIQKVQEPYLDAKTYMAS